jgi:radical SAM superfamily enzyme YgiQ (UPF0313 family)
MTRAVFYHPPILRSPLTTLPLAYLHLATPLRDTAHRIELVDGRLEADPIAALLGRLDDADLLLVSAMPGSQIETGLAACAAARRARPDLPIWWGGPHPSVAPEITASSPLVSGVIVGRGEFVIGELLEAVADGPDALLRVPNTVFRDARGALSRGPGVSFADRPPAPPDLGLLASVEPYLCQTRCSNRMLDYISSFGCPHRCTFCSEPVTSGARWSCMDAATLVGEIAGFVARYRIDGLLFQDAKFVTDRPRLVDICRGLIRAAPGIHWMATACTTDVDSLHADGTLALMRDAGCEQLFIGAEAATAETLRLYRKTVTADGTYRTAKLLWSEYGILPHFSYVLGYPVEDLDRIQQTLALHEAICELVGRPTGELGIYNPVVGTKFLAQNAHHFHVPEDLEGWGRFDYYGQGLQRTPSKELSRLLFQHHVKVRRKYPHVAAHQTLDVWQLRHAG